jgi:hypothetical protein
MTRKSGQNDKLPKSDFRVFSCLPPCKLENRKGVVAKRFQPPLQPYELSPRLREAYPKFARRVLARS